MAVSCFGMQQKTIGTADILTERGNIICCCYYGFHQPRHPLAAGVCLTPESVRQREKAG